MKNLTKVLVLLSFLVSALLTIWGLVHLQWPQSLPWSDKDALIRYVGFLFICTILVFVGSWGSKRSPLIVGGAVATGFILLAGALWPLLVIIWFAVASALLGRTILVVLQGKTEVNNWLTNVLVGVGMYGTAVGLIAHFPISYPGVYALVLAFPILLGWVVLVNESKNFLTRFNKTNIAEFGINRLDVAIVVIALVYVVVALMPEVAYDALAMHLFVPSHLAQRHQWGFDVSTYVWAVMPMLGDWIFSIGYMLGGETAVRLINVGFIFILGWLVRDLVFWAGGSAIGARVAVLIFLSTPLTFTEGGTLFIESIWTSFVLAGTLALLRACSNSGKPRFELLIAGLLLGCALAAKAVTFTILPILLFLLLWRYRSWYKATGLSFLLIGLSLFVALGLIPYITAWVLTGNPVFPMFNKIFHSHYFPDINFDNPLFNAGFTWDVLYKVTFETGKYLESAVGASGFQWILLFLPTTIILVIHKQIKAGVLILVAVVAIVLTFYSQSYLRYIFPSFAILSAAIGVAFSTVLFTRSFTGKLWYGLVIITVALNLIFFSAASHYKDFSFQAIGDESSQAMYLHDHFPIRNAVKLVNHLNIGRTPVAFFSSPLAAGLSADALHPNWYNSVFQQEVSLIKTEQDVANSLLNHGVDFIVLDSNWQGVGHIRGAETVALIEQSTEKITDYGTLSVRRIKPEYLFRGELVVNPNFKSISGWSLTNDVKYDADIGSMLVNVNASATQAIGISPGSRYLNTVVSRCAKESTIGRVQINWMDVNGGFVSTNIKTFECTQNWTEQKMEITAPPKAVIAVIYTTGHTSIPLEFKSNSLRQ